MVANAVRMADEWFQSPSETDEVMSSHRKDWLKGSTEERMRAITELEAAETMAAGLLIDCCQERGLVSGGV